MDDLLLAACTCLSCFIVAAILFQFMNDRYRLTFQNKSVYYIAETATVTIAAGINLLDVWVLNLAIWVVVAFFISCFLYFDETDNGLRRMVECEVLILCMGICETLGLALIDWTVSLIQFDLKNSTMVRCLEITFSKLVMIFIYYMAIDRLMGKKKAELTKAQCVMSLIILIYSLVNVVVMAEVILKGHSQLIVTVNMGCIVLADLYLLYFIKVANEKSALEWEIKILEKQADMQYKYYLAQEQKYHATVNILHDVDRHVKSIETLYASGEYGNATEYTREIKNMLEPLIPIQYTGNPILDILLTDKVTISKEMGIAFGVQIDNVKLDFLAAIDVTTIFGNLIDNAIEAAGKATGDKYIRIHMSPYKEMVFIRIENTSLPLKWKNGVPVSGKGKHHGIGLPNVRRSIEKYDGDMTLRQQDNIVTVDLLLNS